MAKKTDETTDAPQAPEPDESWSAAYGNMITDGNLAVPTPSGSGITAITATADGPESVVLTGGKSSAGNLQYVRTQPFGIAVGESVPTQTVDGRGDVLQIYADGRWITAPVDEYPVVA